jgi:hypothetical protein
MKYGKVIVEGKNIPEGEPLFILRGQDNLAVDTMRHYISLLEWRASLATTPAENERWESMIADCKQIVYAMEAWPRKKWPD